MSDLDHLYGDLRTQAVMTVRRVVLYAATSAALAYILACATILHSANQYDRVVGPRP